MITFNELLDQKPAQVLGYNPSVHTTGRDLADLATHTLNLDDGDAIDLSSTERYRIRKFRDLCLENSGVSRL